MKTIAESYRCFIDLPGTGWVQVYPQNGELKWVIKKKTGYRFYQKVLETKLVFVDAPADGLYDFTKLANLERMGKTCEKVPIKFDVYCECDNTWSIGFYQGWLKLAQAKEWNFFLCQVELPVVVDDGYGCLTSNWGKDINMFDYGPEPETITPFVGVIQFLECGPEQFFAHWNNPFPPYVLQQITNNFWGNFQFDCLPDLPPGSAGNVVGPWVCIRHTHITNLTWNIDFGGPFPGSNNSLDTHQLIKSRWAREFVAGVTMPDGPGWVAVTGGWARPVPITNQTIVDHTTVEGQAALEEVWGTDNFEWGALATWDIVGVDDNGNSILTNGKDLGGFLQGWLDEKCPGITLVSNFYNIAPDNTNPVNKYYDAAREDFDRLVLFQVTDVARLDETTSATKAEFAIKELIDTFKIPHNTNIELDDDGVTLRWEHESYWGRLVGLDLTTKDPDILYGKDIYTHDNETQPNKEKFGWSQETDKEGGDFDGYPIEYSNACVDDREQPKEDSYRSSKFLTNVSFVIGNEDFYDTKECLIVAVKDDMVEQVLQPISGDLKFNGVLALGYCLPRYHDYARPFKRGLINKIDTPLYSTVRSKKQVDITFSLSCVDFRDNFRAKDLIRTQLGAGEVDQAIWVEPQEEITVSLKQK